MDIKNLLILSMVKSVGPAFIKKNLSKISRERSCEAIVEDFKPEELENIENYAKVADQIIEDCQFYGIDIVSIQDESYPSLLSEISDPPSVIFIKGNKSLLTKAVAIIGTRHSSALGNKIAERVGSYFSDRYSICNGLVEGIDEHSIYINGHVTKNVVGIISGGLIYKDTCSLHHIKVIEDVLNAGGLILSEFYPRQKEDKYSGSRASRIQAGLSRGLILVQSKADGGSKYTLEKFAKLGRPIGIIHYPSSEEYNSELFGANRLIVEKGKEGVAQIINKKPSLLNLGKLITLANKDDYDAFIREMDKPKSSMLF